MSRTEITFRLRAPRERVYRAFTDAADLQRWRVPPSMRSEVHAFDARVGGAFRVTLTYQGEGAGKTTARSDTYHGRFVELVPPARIVEVLEFETARRQRARLAAVAREAGGARRVVPVTTAVKAGPPLPAAPPPPPAP